ncbi:MAG: Exodeoxyribonuclease 7 large subunit [Patescibacteria group bacterium]|nr:exodeoxyribonuclease VII large subunit [Candidatus Saccharibacteria bacterium]MDQ5963758.1 Exodeoxyribonuclease 7 large subunit [Patescibacteria group bacterium]
MNEVPVVGVSDFLVLVNQTLEYAYPFIAVEGEILEYKVSKNRWVYITLKDEFATVRCFTTVYALPNPLEVGMVVRLYGAPHIHEKYGFSLQVQQVRLVGEGTLKKGCELLFAKLRGEGLFDTARKRSLPAVPSRIAVVTARDSAACADFIKITKARWCGVEVTVFDSYVQGDHAPENIIQTLQTVQSQPELPEVVVLIRGGGSKGDLAAFSHEGVVRAVAECRVPTLVAIGHEVDESLAELAADVRASTPSNAAELLFPDKKVERIRLAEKRQELARLLRNYTVAKRQKNLEYKEDLGVYLQVVLDRTRQAARTYRDVLIALDPMLPLERGYALIRDERGEKIVDATSVSIGDLLRVHLRNGTILTEVKAHYADEKKGKA